MRRVGPALVLAGAGLLLVAAAGTPPAALYPAGDPVRVAALKATCIACHGAAGPPAGAVKAPVPLLQHQRKSAIFYALQDYRSGARRSDAMRPMAAALSDQQMRDLAAALVGTRAAPPKAVLADSWAHARVAQQCGFCHGETGLGVVEGYPILSGQKPEYLEAALAAYRSGARSNSTMRRIAATVTADQAHQLAVYFAAQKVLEPAR